MPTRTTNDGRGRDGQFVLLLGAARRRVLEENSAGNLKYSTQTERMRHGREGEREDSAEAEYEGPSIHPETNSIQVLRSVFNTVLEYYSLGGRY